MFYIQCCLFTVLWLLRTTKFRRSVIKETNKFFRNAFDLQEIMNLLNKLLKIILFYFNLKISNAFQ
jgi:tellurite resistance protein TehA-like permease